LSLGLLDKRGWTFAQNARKNRAMSDKTDTTRWPFIFVIVALLLLVAVVSYGSYWNYKWTECREKIGDGSISNPKNIPQCDHWNAAP
jgi:cytochrome c-type biogenesis protein CcmH/NrfG